MSESGHSQPGMYGQGRRRRRRRGDRDAGPPGQNLSGPSRDREYQPRERRDGSEDPPGPLMQKTPIILAKPPGERAKPSQNASVSGAPVLEKPIMLMKARDDGGKPGTPPEAAAQPSGPGPSKMEKEGQRPTQPVYQIQNRGMGSSASSSAVDPMVGQSKLLPPEKMKHSIKLVDDQMNWCDSAMEYLRDQTDMLVVGVIGLQGAGKSTVMSLLSANTPEEDQRGYVFRAQTQEIKERGGNQTTGIDFFITQERVIFLDTQPMLSPSILDHLINNDRKLPPEYNLPHTYVEMQSLQIAAFLFTVCHVVIVVQDWFTDLNLYRFLQTAEMLKPSTPSASHDSTGSSGNDDGAEYYPHIVFLQNKARRDDFCPRNLKNMHMVVDKLMAHSHLKYKGTLSMLDCSIFPGLGQDYLATEVNMFLLPVQENDGDDNLTKAGSGTYPLFSLLPGYRGHPAFSTMVSKLRSQILAMPRCQLSHTILTEKNCLESQCSMPGTIPALRKCTTKVLDSQTKGCVPEELCGDASLNSGLSRHVISTKCCLTDLCNKNETSACTLKCYECIPDGPETCEDKEVACPPLGNQCATIRVISYVGMFVVFCVITRFFTGPVYKVCSLVEGRVKNSDEQTKGCLLAEQCAASSLNFGTSRIIVSTDCCSTDLCNVNDTSGGLKVSDLQMKSCVVQEQCGETSINFGLGRHVITTECCAIDFCNTKPASEPSRHTPNGKKCYHCNGPKCTATLNCEGNEDHCITKTVISGEKQKIIKGCASSKMCSSTVNAEIKGAIGGTFTCCQGDYCNSASSTSAGLLLLVAPLVSFVMFS
ncbi:Protein SMG9 [Larimichthys crocea]|uniref:Uncharacterized protein n=1 Tax=Larimichthys crocea TaxID=215358 RepID=A0ACD3QVF1_LARCR|nr:Protein SMG9 [Larimichthys crocea]